MGFYNTLVLFPIRVIYSKTVLNQEGLLISFGYYLAKPGSEGEVNSGLTLFQGMGAMISPLRVGTAFSDSPSPSILMLHTSIYTVIFVCNEA